MSDPMRDKIAMLVALAICDYNGMIYVSGASEIPEALEVADNILAALEAEPMLYDAEAENARLREALMDQIRNSCYQKNQRPDVVAMIEARGDLIRDYACPAARALLTDTEEGA